MSKATRKESHKANKNIITHEKRVSIRLNKYISDSGFCSRREADKIIEQGLVTIDGRVAVLGDQVLPHQEVRVSNNLIKLQKNDVYIMLHKPRGIVTTNDLKTKNNIREFVNYEELIFPIGRLDKDSTGLILLTNDGDIVNKILRAEYGHEKEYVVTVDKDLTDEFINNMANGVLIFNQVANKNQVTLKCKVTKLDKRTFKIVLKQGLNRQIRRMTQALGYNVKALKRIRVMNLRLGDLKVAEWRYLTVEELESLNKQINNTKQ